METVQHVVAERRPWSSGYGKAFGTIDDSTGQPSHPGAESREKRPKPLPDVP